MDSHSNYVFAHKDEIDVSIKTIEKLEAENKKLRERDRWLDALEAAGVDNWEGYDKALEILREEQNETQT